MKMENRIDVAADASRNVMQISYVGLIGAAEMQRAEDEIARAASSLRPGFSLLTDLSELTSMDLSCAPYIERTMDLMRERGVEFVVRVIPNPSKDIGMGIMSLFHYPSGLKIVTTPTREDAAHLLPPLA